MTDNRIKELELEIEKIRLEQAGEKKDKDFSIGWFIFWLIIFWPIALVYAIYKHFK